jgi:hypothetical protein
MRTALIVMLALTFTASFTRQTLARDIFEKTKWKIAVEPDDDSRKSGGKKFDDTISFKGNKLESEELKKHGFEPGAYEGDVRGGAMGTFKATQTSEKEGKAEWSGTITASEMKGELTWTKADGTVLKYSYTGSKKD